MIRNDKELDGIYQYDNAIKKLKSMLPDISESFIENQLIASIELLEVERARLSKISLSKGILVLW